MGASLSRFLLRAAAARASSESCAPSALDPLLRISLSSIRYIHHSLSQSRLPAGLFG